MIPLVLGSDHAGFQLKQTLKEKLKAEEIAFEDLGANSEERVDFPDFAAQVAEAVRCGKAKQGLLICGTGQGMAISANKFPGIRAVAIGDPYSARMAREHNDANILCLGGRLLGSELAWEIVQTFLKTKFSGGRHEARVKKIKSLEQKFLR